MRRGMAASESTLVLGPSGTGKTMFVLKKLCEIQKSLVIINGGEDVIQEYKKFRPRLMDLSDNLRGLRRVSLVVEDFVREKEREGRSLVKILGYLKRHQKCTIFLNTYMIQSTGASSLLSLFDKVVFTRHPANARSLKLFVRLFPVENLGEGTFRSFLAGKNRYLEVDMKSQRFRFLGDSAEATANEGAFGKAERFSDSKHHLEALLATFPEPELLTSLLNFLQRNVDLVTFQG